MTFYKVTQFGNLNLKNGERATFKDFDTNGDKIISESEYQKAIKEMELNDVDFEQIDLDENSELSYDEFTKFEQMTLMQEYVNDLENDIYADFYHNSTGMRVISNALANYIQEFSDNYGDKNISQMATVFRNALPVKYKQLVEQYATDETRTMQFRVINEVSAPYSAEVLSAYMDKPEFKDTFVSKAQSNISYLLGEMANEFISGYTGSNLEADMRSYLKDWIETNLSVVVEQTKSQVIQEDYENFTSVDGSAYTVNQSEIDYSFNPLYNMQNGIIIKNEGSLEKSKQAVLDEGYKILNNESLKTQIRAQIQNNLAKNGISFDRVSNVFDNAYSKAIQDTLNSEDIINTDQKITSFMFFALATMDVKNCIDKFINNFNAEMVEAISGMNQASDDFDTQNIDYSVLKLENHSYDYEKLYKNGEKIPLNTGDSHYVTVLSNNLIDKLKPQFLEKTKELFLIKGIDFDESVFNTIFENSKNATVDLIVNGNDASSLNENLMSRILNITNIKTQTFNTKQLIDTFASTFKHQIETYGND